MADVPHQRNVSLLGEIDFLCGCCDGGRFRVSLGTVVSPVDPHWDPDLPSDYVFRAITRCAGCDKFYLVAGRSPEQALLLAIINHRMCSND